MKLSGKIKLLSSFCACVLVSIQFQVGSAGFLHLDPDDDFHSLLRSGSNTPVYSVYSRHLSQPYFYRSVSTTAAPKPQILPPSSYRSSSRGNPVIQYVLLQPNDYIRHLPFLPDTESRPNKPKRKNNKKKTTEVEESEGDSKKKDNNEGSGEDTSDDKENGGSTESEKENTSPTKSKSPPRKNPRKNSNSRLPSTSRSGAGSNKKNNEENAEGISDSTNTRESSESGEENTSPSKSKSPPRKNSGKNSSSPLTSGSRSGAKPRDNNPITPRQRQTNQSSKSKPRNTSRLRKSGRLLGSSSEVAPSTKEINDALDNSGEPVSLPEESEPRNTEEVSPESASPAENNSAPNGQELSNIFEEFSPSSQDNGNNGAPNFAGNEIPTRERIDEAIKILSSVANQISQFSTNPGTFGGAAATQQIQPGNINFGNSGFSNNNNNAGRSGNGNSQQYGAPIDIQRANNINFSNREGNGNNNVSPQYGTPQETAFRNVNIFQQSQREQQQFVRNTNGEAYELPGQQSSQTQAVESSDSDTASTINLPYSQALRNIRSDSANSQSNFELIKSESKVY